jgi:lipopolysaccharide transport system permease protein
VPYVLIVYAAILPWTIFNQIVSRGTPSVVADRAIVTNIYFPREILPLSHAFPVLLDFSVAFAFFLILSTGYGHPPGWAALTLPFLACVPLLLAAGVVLALSSLNVHFRDIGYALPFSIQALMYASPIAYSMTLIPEEWRFAYALNPIAGIVESFRWALLGGREFPLAAFASASVLSIVVFIGGSLLFRRLERGFADVI